MEPPNAVTFLSEEDSGTIFPQHFATLRISGDNLAANLLCSPVSALGKKLN